MKYKMFVVHDSKVGAYLQPMFFRSVGECTRAFETEVNNISSQFNKYPGDFTLFCIGEYDESVGTLEMYPTKANLGLALDFKTVPAPTPIEQAIAQNKMAVAR